MVRKKVLTFGGLLLSCLATAAELHITVQPYFTYLSYSNSKIKNNGWASTLYGSLSINQSHIFEGAWGYTHLDYKGNLSNWNQNDYAIAYTNYMLFPWYGKIGFHYITTPNTDISDDTKIYFADVGYIAKYRWNTGLFLSYSDYRNDVAATEGQLHGGFYHWFDYYSGLYFHGNARWIHLSHEEKIYLSKKNYYSVGLGVNYFNSRYTVGISGWLGERIFDVDNGGFIVYNLAEKYKGGAKISGTYYFTKKLWVGLELSYSEYKERTLPGNRNVKERSLTGNRNVDVYGATLSIGYAF